MIPHWKQKFVLLWTGQALSILSSMVSQYALIWYLTDLTGSPAVLSLATMAAMVPQGVLSLFTGAFADRFDRRIIMMVSDGAIGLISLALAALGSALEDDGLIEASLSVFQPSVDIIAHGSYDLRSVAESGAGAYSGFAGTLWSIAAAGRILGRPEYLAVARAGLRLVRPAAPQPTPDWCDVITGAAGTAVVGLALAEGAGAAGATAVCRAALEADLVHRLPSSGLAHGVAGLLWLAARTHRHGADPAAAALAEQADRELRTAFATGAGGISTSRETEQLSDSWCNGIAGQLVATASAVEAGLVDPERLRELVARIPHGQVATALTLCHGTLGLHEVARMLPTWAGAAPLVDVLTGYLGADRLRGGLEEVHSRQALGPSLMVGQGGLAWHLATRLRPDLPSPLTLTGIGVSA